jgi:hypothetical protein
MAKKLPLATPKFAGKAERLITHSTPSKLGRNSAPEGAPNIVLILLDDVGFGSFGTFGGPVPTPLIALPALVFVTTNFIPLHCVHQHGQQC